MDNKLEKNENIYEGYIAMRAGEPVFVYDQNVVVALTDESRQTAFTNNGKGIRGELLFCNPEGVYKARIVSFTGDKAKAPKVVGNVRVLTEHLDKLRSQNVFVSRAWLESVFYSGWNGAVAKDHRGPHKMCKDVVRELLGGDSRKK